MIKNKDLNYKYIIKLKIWFNNFKMLLNSHIKIILII